MSERKVLNKYYPPDFDPANIPRMKFNKNKTFNIRLMAPCNMRCNTCGEYIYKGKKFNSRKEDVEDEYYHGLRIFRFYIKCPKCVSEIAFKTDLEKTDYILEAGATRLFEAEKLAKEIAEREQREKEDEELNNPMKVLENRTKASRNEIEQIDTLEELREMSARQAKVDTETMLLQHKRYEEKLRELQEEEEEKEIKAIFGQKAGQSLKRLVDNDDDIEEDKPAIKKKHLSDNPTDILTDASLVISMKGKSRSATEKKVQSWERSVGGFSNKKSLMNLVKKKEKNPIVQNGLSSNCDKSTSEPLVTDQKQTKDSQKSDAASENAKNTGSAKTNGSLPSSLQILGTYSDSESDSS